MVERFVQYYRKRTNQVIGIVIHYMGIEKAPIDLCIKIFNDRKVSADYMIDLDGTIYKLIPDGNYSYHAGESIMPTGESALTSTGKKTVNQITVGIELMGTINTLFTDAQYIALIGLTKTLKQKFPAINNEHIVGHQHVCIPKGRKIDPGKLFTWDRYKSSL
jgi:AmpD protein